jgi:hypothetical protein
MAQIAIPVPGSPVPVTGQTLGVLLIGASYGPVLSISTVALYLAIGAAVTGGLVGLGAVGIPMMLSGTNTAGEADMAVTKPTLPNRNNNFPSYNNNQGNGAAGNQRSEEQRKIEIYTTLNMDGKDVSKVMKTSEYSYS